MEIALPQTHRGWGRDRNGKEKVGNMEGGEVEIRAGLREWRGRDGKGREIWEGISHPVGTSVDALVGLVAATKPPVVYCEVGVKSFTGWSKKADTRFIFAITSANEHRF